MKKVLWLLLILVLVMPASALCQSAPQIAGETQDDVYVNAFVGVAFQKPGDWMEDDGTLAQVSEEIGMLILEQVMEGFESSKIETLADETYFAYSTSGESVQITVNRSLYDEEPVPLDRTILLNIRLNEALGVEIEELSAKEIWGQEYVCCRMRNQPEDGGIIADYYYRMQDGYTILIGVCAYSEEDIETLTMLILRDAETLEQGAHKL